MTETEMAELETLKAQLAQWKRIVQVREAIEQMLTEKLCESQQQVRELRELIGVVIGVRRLPDILPLIVVERLEQAALRSAPPSAEMAPSSGPEMYEKMPEAFQAFLTKTNAWEERQDLAKGSDVRGDVRTIGAENADVASTIGQMQAPPLSNERASEQESGTSSIGLERGVSNSEVARSSPASLTTNCMDCGAEEAADEVDTVLTLDQWRLINPEVAGVLCASCIVRRAARLPRVIGTFLYITFASDYKCTSLYAQI